MQKWKPRNKYGFILKQERIARGLKAGYVATRIKVTAGTYSQIECCRRGLSADRLLEILSVLGMTLGELEERLPYAQRKNLPA